MSQDIYFFSGTCYQGIKETDKFENYKSLMLDQYLPIRQIAKKVGISIQTAFDWRHKIMSGLKVPVKGFEGITEIDDVWFLYSQKGRKGLDYARKRGGSKRRGDNNFQVKLLITTDRKSNRDMSVVRIGRIKKSDLERKISGKFNDTCVIVSDKHRSISAFAKAEKIQHVNFKASNHTAGGEYHVQTINNLASRLKTIVNHQLRGVSSKYLQSYTNWFDYKEKVINSVTTENEMNNQLGQNKSAWETYINIENSYKEFIENLSVRTYRCPTKRNWSSSRKSSVGSATKGYI